MNTAERPVDLIGTSLSDDGKDELLQRAESLATSLMGLVDRMRAETK